MDIIWKHGNFSEDGKILAKDFGELTMGPNSIHYCQQRQTIIISLHTMSQSVVKQCLDALFNGGNIPELIEDDERKDAATIIFTMNLLTDFGISSFSVEALSEEQACREQFRIVAGANSK